MDDKDHIAKQFGYVKQANMSNSEKLIMSVELIIIELARKETISEQ